MRICGIDEAGKGPALGSLVLCGVATDEKNVKALENLGVKDSKLLSKKERELLYESLITQVEYEVVVVTPKEIDTAIESQTSNLNLLEAEKTASIIKKLKPNKVFVDCPDPTPSNYLIQIEKHLLSPPEIIAEHRAERYAVVAAASIIAKVLRDRSIEALQQEHNVDFGSGYASDPKTQEFLKDNWENKEFHHLMRKSWASYKNVKKEKEQSRLGDY